MIRVTKRNGSLEPVDYDKIHEVVKYACDGVDNVSISDIILNSKISFFDSISTDDIQKTLIKTAMDMVNETTPNYDIVSGRLVNFDLRKKVYGSYTPNSLLSVIKHGIELGLYHKDLLTIYTEDQWNDIEKLVDHTRDEAYTIIGMSVWLDKYLVKDRSTGLHIETPQYANIMIAALLSMYEKEDVRMSYIARHYKLLCTNAYLWPTPVMAGLRTSMKQFSSCVVLSVDDSLDGINAAANSIVEYASRRAGLGVDMTRIRAEGSKIKGGLSVTTGVIPFTRYLAGALKSCSQGGIRNSAATFNYQIWHKEVLDLLVLKNNKGTYNTRIRDIDYVFHWNKYLIKRAINKRNISLFCPHDVIYGKYGDLHKAFYGKDPKEFATIYEAYEKDKSVSRTNINGWELLKNYLSERDSTGRLYLFLADTVNSRSTYNEKITLTNLCVEILLPTEPDSKPGASDGLISLCTLGGVNMTSKTSIKEVMTLLVRGLNAILDYQEYANASAERATKMYRPLGIGLSNYAYWLAKNDFHNEKDLTKMRTKIHEYAESMYYYALDASVDLAKEHGKCPGYDKLQYSKGILNIDMPNESLLDKAPYDYKLDWPTLRDKQLKYGVRNAQLLAFMPNETSALLSNATNGIELIRDFVIPKECKGYIAPMVVPEFTKLKHKYKKVFDFTNHEFCEFQLVNMAIFQHYVCQSISTNTYSFPRNGKIHFGDSYEQFMYAVKYNLKTLYYNYVDKDKIAVEANEQIDGTEVLVEIAESNEACAGGFCAL